MPWTKLRQAYGAPPRSPPAQGAGCQEKKRMKNSRFKFMIFLGLTLSLKLPAFKGLWLTVADWNVCSTTIEEPLYFATTCSVFTPLFALQTSTEWFPAKFYSSTMSSSFLFSPPILLVCRLRAISHICYTLQQSFGGWKQWNAAYTRLQSSSDTNTYTRILQWGTFPLSLCCTYSSSSASFLLGVKARVHARQFPVRKQTT